MKLAISLIISIFVLCFIYVPSAFAVFCDPPLTGNWSINSSCVQYEDVNGTAKGDVTIEAGTTVTLHNSKKFVWYPGQKINIATGGHIIINPGAQMDQNFICVKESGTNSNYPAFKNANDSRYGTQVYLGLDQATATTISESTLDTQIVGKWTMSNCTGSTVTDSAAAANHGTITLGSTGTTTTGTCSPVTGAWGAGATGMIGSSLAFDGTDDHLSMPNNRSNETTATYAFWYKANRVGNGGGGAFSASPLFHSNQTNQGFWVEWRNNGLMQLYLANSGGLVNGTFTTTTDTTSWHHVAFTIQSGGIAAMYFDGQFKGSFAAGTWNNFSGNLLAGTGSIGTNNQSAYNQYFQGQIDEIRFYTRTLSAAEISSLAGYPNTIGKFCDSTAGYKRRETFLSKDYVDLGTTGTTALATPYRWFLNNGFGISNTTTANGLGGREENAPSAPARTVDASVIVCTGSGNPASCGSATAPADGGNLIAENKLGIGTTLPSDPVEIKGADGTWLGRFGNATNYLTLSRNQLASNGTALKLNHSSSGHVFFNMGGGKLGINSSTPAYTVELNGIANTKAAYDATANIAQYDIGGTKIGIRTSLSTTSRICSGNSSADCTGTGGTVLNGGTYTPYGGVVRFRNGPQFAPNTQLLNFYPAGYTNTNSGLAMTWANGSTHAIGAYIHTDASGANFGLLNNAYQWTLINYNTGSSQIVNRFGIGQTSFDTAWMAFRANPGNSGSQSPNVAVGVYGVSPQVLVESAGVTGVTAESGSTSYNAGFKFFKWNGSVYSTEWQLYAFAGSNDLILWNTSYGTYIRMYLTEGDVEFHGPPGIFPGRATTDGIWFRQNSTVDTWLRITKINNIGTYHDLYIGSLYANGASRFDIAEVTPVNPRLEYVPGTLVSIDSSENLRLTKSHTDYDNKLVGIVSHLLTASMVIGGETGPESLINLKDKKPIALAGRVITLVNLDGGSIKAGDPITSSKKDGIGMKANKAGQVIARSMDNFDGHETNSAGVKHIISGLKQRLAMENMNAKDKQELTNTIAILEADLPKNTGRIISFVNNEMYVPSQLQDLKQAIENQQQTITNLTNEINALTSK